MNGGASTGEPALTRDLADRRAEDRALGDALAGLLGHLRGFAYARFYGRPEEALCDEADRFVGRLAKHLRYVEETLFPALGQVEPRFAQDIEALKNEHRRFDSYTRDLAVRILGGDKEGAYEVGRTFLAVLLDHIRRETAGVDRFVHCLDAFDARRMSEAMAEGRRPSDRDESLNR